MKIRSIGTTGVLALLFTGVLAAQDGTGRVRFVKRAGAELDRYTNTQSASDQGWMRNHFFRLAGVFSPYFDNKTSWFPQAWVYQDLYAVKPSDSLASQHPDWLLHDSSGRTSYVPWGCSGGTCPQYAGDPGNPSFRRWWIDHLKGILNSGYKGVWIDDVNMQFRVGDGNGNEVAPVDPRTGSAMTWDNWRRYIAEFVEQIRAELPNAEILHNSIWFAGPNGIRDNDSYIQRQIAAADYINCERGISDAGLTGGNGEWSLNAFFSYVDRVHALGRSVVFDDYYPTGLEYPLAGYYLISNGRDGTGELISNIDNWWRGYDTDLGNASGNRYNWNGLLRRDFQNGIVLLSLPGSPTQTVQLPGTYVNVDGFQVNSVTLSGSQGAVLKSNTPVATNPAPAPAPAPSPSNPPGSGVRYVSDLTATQTTNGWGPFEKDRSNNDWVAGDGHVLSINGKQYGKGIGAHAFSDVQYSLAGACNSFQAEVGIDDEVPFGLGSVIFQVWSDNNLIFTTGLMTSGMPAQPVNIPVNGRSQISLVIVSGLDGNIDWDHGDWGDARLNCQ